jgi:hypothetical protein
MKIGTLVAALAGGIVMFGLGFLFFGVLFAEYFMANTTQYPGLVKDPPVVWAIFLFNLAWAWLVAWVVERSAPTIQLWAEGAKVGAIVLFVLGVGIDLEFHAFMHLHKELAPMLLHILIVTFMGAVAGAVIGWIIGYFNRRAA